MKTIVNPKTGRMETVDDAPGTTVTQADVERTRRELRDMLSGNTQFHQEENTPAVPETPSADLFDPDDFADGCLYVDNSEYMSAKEVSRARA